MPEGANALDLGHFLRTSGRWNRPDEYGCLYTSLTRDGAIAELTKLLRRYELTGQEYGPRELVDVRVSVVPVVPVISEEVHQRLGLDPAKLIGDTPEDIEYCRAVADLLRAQGCRAILSPSAALVGAANLNIYIEGPSANLSLSPGGHREPVVL